MRPKSLGLEIDALPRPRRIAMRYELAKVNAAIDREFVETG